MADNDNNEIEQKAASETTGKGKSGKSGGGVRLPPEKLKEVTGSWEYLDAAKAAARVAEFFGEGVAKAAANAVVAFDNIKSQGYAIVTQFIKWGQDKGREISYLMKNLTRENAEILRQRYGMNVGPSG